MKTINEIAAECVRIAIEQGALNRADAPGLQASEAPAFLGPTEPLDGDYEHLRGEVGTDPDMLDEGRAFGLSHAAAREFRDAFADAIAECICHPERQAEMARHSRALATGVHTIENFSNDISAFWAAVTQR